MSQSQTCSCANRNCFHDDCACFTREGLCSEYCECRGDCKNIWKHEKEVTKQFAEYTKRKAADAAAQDAADQAAAQPQPKPLPALEPGSARKPCSCVTSKCENRYCRCIRAGLLCYDRCTCKDCDNTKRNPEKLQNLFPGSGIKGEVPSSGSTMVTRGAALAAKESAVGCKCQTECTSRCGCVRRNI